jgi:hypothetical protein
MEAVHLYLATTPWCRSVTQTRRQPHALRRPPTGRPVPDGRTAGRDAGVVGGEWAPAMRRRTDRTVGKKRAGVSRTRPMPAAALARSLLACNLGGQIAVLTEHHVEHGAIMIDRAVEVLPVPLRCPGCTTHASNRSAPTAISRAALGRAERTCAHAKPRNKANERLTATIASASSLPIGGPSLSRNKVMALSTMICDLLCNPFPTDGSTVNRNKGASTIVLDISRTVAVAVIVNRSD